MEISIETWKRYSYEVIDYESDDLLNSFFEINAPGFIYRNKDEILNTKYKLQNNIEKLFEILLNENFNYELKFNHFEFDEDGIVKTNNSAWFALIKSKMDDEIDLNVTDYVMSKDNLSGWGISGSYVFHEAEASKNTSQNNCSFYPEIIDYLEAHGRTDTSNTSEQKK